MTESAIKVGDRYTYILSVILRLTFFKSEQIEVPVHSFLWNL